MITKLYDTVEELIKISRMQEKKLVPKLPMVQIYDLREIPFFIMPIDIHKKQKINSSQCKSMGMWLNRTLG